MTSTRIYPPMKQNVIKLPSLINISQECVSNTSLTSNSNPLREPKHQNTLWKNPYHRFK